MRKMFKKLCLSLTLIMGLLLPGLAAASVDIVTNWPATPTIVSNGTATTASGKFTAGLGNNRAMVIAVATKYSVAGAPTIAVTYGGQTVTAITNAIIKNNNDSAKKRMINCNLSAPKTLRMPVSFARLNTRDIVRLRKLIQAISSSKAATPPKI